VSDINIDITSSRVNSVMFIASSMLQPAEIDIDGESITMHGKADTPLGNSVEYRARFPHRARLYDFNLQFIGSNSRKLASKYELHTYLVDVITGLAYNEE